MTDKLTDKERQNLSVLYKEDFANFFNVSFTNGKYSYNINKSIYFEDFETYAQRFFYRYEVQERDTWPLIAYKNHGTIELWWLVCRANQVWDPTVDPIPGETIKILNEDIVNEVLRSINT